MWHYLGAKTNKLWIWTALDRASGRLIDWECGGRDQMTFERLLARLRRWKVRLICTDEYVVYQHSLSAGRHYAGKDQTVALERTHSRLRHWLARFRRRTWLFPDPRRWSTVPLPWSPTCTSTRKSTQASFTYDLPEQRREFGGNARKIHHSPGTPSIYQRPNTSKAAPEHTKYPYLLGGLTIDREPGVVYRHYLHSAGQGLHLPGGDHGLALAGGAGLEDFKHAARRLLHRCPGRGAAAVKARTGIAAWLRFYTEERLHQAHGYRTPRQIYEGNAGGHPGTIRLKKTLPRLPSRLDKRGDAHLRPHAHRASTTTRIWKLKI